MKILYGVTGEGLGHAMRSRVIAEHLRDRGHTVKLTASHRAFYQPPLRPRDLAFSTIDHLLEEIR
ncbi:MAG: glycosyltransferase family protein [Kofleriaceae bacterium]